MHPIFIIEDDPKIAKLIRLNLIACKYQVKVFHDARTGMQGLEETPCALLILDRMLPITNGIKVLRWLRHHKQLKKTPVLMVSAMGMTNERIAGLKEGADDYLSKPFDPDELIARVQALLRRSNNQDEAILLQELNIFPDEHRVSVQDKDLSLRPLEFRLLHLLASRPRKVFERSYLLDHVWGRDAEVEQRTVDVTIKRLRKKLKKHELDHLIETVRGTGYRLNSKKN